MCLPLQIKVLQFAEFLPDSLKLSFDDDDYQKYREVFETKLATIKTMQSEGHNALAKMITYATAYVRSGSSGQRAAAADVERRFTTQAKAMQKIIEETISKLTKKTRNEIDT